MMRLFYSLLLILSFSCAHTAQFIDRNPDNDQSLGCFELLDSVTGSTRRYQNARQLYEKIYRENDGIIHLDIGGEGRHANAINLNPQSKTTTTGVAGRDIPNWLEGRGDDIPLPDDSIHRISVENAPLNPQAILEIIRVLRPRGKISLIHPEDYADEIHEKIILELGQNIDDFSTVHFIQNEVPMSQTEILLK